MLVRLLYFDECPNWLVVVDHLAALADEIPGLVVEHVIVDTPEAVEREQFQGSPSICVDGRDLFSTRPDSIGLSCRFYQTPDGPAGAPTLDQLRSALTSIGGS